MKVKIEYTKGKNTKEDILALKEYIQQKKIKGVTRVALATPKLVKDEVGVGVVPAITAMVGSLTDPLTELAHSLVEMVKLKRSEIRLSGISGAELYISGKVKEKDLENAIQQFFNQEKANVKVGVKREKQPSLPPLQAQAEELAKKKAEEEKAEEEKTQARRARRKKAQEEKPKDEKSQEEKPKDEKPKDEKSKDEKPKEEDKPKDKGKESKSSDGKK